MLNLMRIITVLAGPTGTNMVSVICTGLFSERRFRLSDLVKHRRLLLIRNNAYDAS